MKRVLVTHQKNCAWNINKLKAIAATLALLLSGLVPLTSARAEGWPSTVRADYDISFNGFSVGNFTFEAEAERQVYTVSGNASLSLLFGALKWKSEVRTVGAIAKDVPKPAGYTFDVVSGNKAVSTRMGFDEGMVNSINNVPEALHTSPIVPLKPQHLQGVVDPMSAMMLLAYGSAPCDRRIPIFDGRERFDLVFSRKGETRISEQQPSGQPGVGLVCRVRYVPIAGHKLDDSTRYMANTEDIELVLRPIPSAKIYVPYQITIPLPVGSAKLTSKRVEIVQVGRPRIALLH
jgi:hypothetical protein